MILWGNFISPIDFDSFNFFSYLTFTQCHLLPSVLNSISLISKPPTKNIPSGAGAICSSCYFLLLIWKPINLLSKISRKFIYILLGVALPCFSCYLFLLILNSITQMLKFSLHKIYLYRSICRWLLMFQLPFIFIIFKFYFTTIQNPAQNILSGAGGPIF